METNKNYFQFRFTDELTKGDVFKFTDSNDTFYTVIKVDVEAIHVQRTYGKLIGNITILNDNKREVMVFPDRKRNIK